MTDANPIAGFLSETTISDKNAESGINIVIAGGGTGGHLFPGIAIADEFMDRWPGSRVLFVTSGKKIEETVLAKTEFDTRLISVHGIKGKGLFLKLSSLFQLPKGLAEAIRLLAEFKPDIVIGMGAYSAGPVIAAAWMLRMHRVIHEQNSIPGLTNRLLAKIAEKIYVSFPDTGFKRSVRHKIKVFGNPVRRDILASVEADDPEAFPVDDIRQSFTVLVLGGSQGAHSINMAVLDSLIHLQEADGAERFRFIHQTGERDAEEVAKVYRQMKMEAEVAPFFSDMGKLYHKADLVICRSGATTVAELTAVGKAALFIPFPFATDDHQMLNAKALAEEGAAAMILEKNLTGSLLAEKMVYYSQHPVVTAKMAKKIRVFGHPKAARNIVDDICRLIGRSAGQNKDNRQKLQGA